MLVAHGGHLLTYTLSHSYVNSSATVCMLSLQRPARLWRKGSGPLLPWGLVSSSVKWGWRYPLSEVMSRNRLAENVAETQGFWGVGHADPPFPLRPRVSAEAVAT